FNDAIVTSLRLINRGWLPSFQTSPSSPLLSHAMKLLSAGVRPGFLEFPELLRKFIDFDEIARWGARQEAPVLVVGSANITTGKLVKFMSNHAPIRLEHILASCAVPTRHDRRAGLLGRALLRQSAGRRAGAVDQRRRRQRAGRDLDHQDQSD